MAPLISRSPQTTTTPENPNSWLTSQQSQPQEPAPAPLSLNSILAIIAGILLAVLLAVVIFSIARKRQRKRSPKPKSLAQLNFFEKLAADGRNVEEGRRRENRDTWRRDTFLYAAETGLEKGRRVMAEPEKTWVITPIEPVVIRTRER
jgi:hypothetical protein